MSGRAKFVHWYETGFDDIPDEPMFNVIENNIGRENGSTVGIKQLLEEYGIPLPLFPDYKTWRTLVDLQKICGRCYFHADKPADLQMHFADTHTCGAWARARAGRAA